MGLRINKNIAALNAYRNLSVTDGQMSKSLEKLSSGFRINRAADDAAGLAISEGLRSQVGGLKVAVRNAQDGISVVQTAEGALTEVHSMLQRMNDLSVQDAQRHAEHRLAGRTRRPSSTQLQEEITRIADNTKFNGVALFAGADLAFQVGLRQRATRSRSTGADRRSRPSTPRRRRHHRQHHGADRDHRRSRRQRAALGAVQNRFEHTINSLNVAIENLSASESRIRDTDMAPEMVDFTRSQILSQAGTAMLAQANQAPQGVLSLLR